jgi:hypothetical protein
LSGEAKSLIGHFKVGTIVRIIGKDKHNTIYVGGVGA